MRLGDIVIELFLRGQETANRSEPTVSKISIRQLQHLHRIVPRFPVFRD